MLESLPFSRNKLPFISKSTSQDITECSTRVRQALSEQVGEAGGEVVVIVHPFYQKGYGSDLPITTTYSRNIEAFVEQSREKRKPIVIFEEAGQERKLQKLLPLASDSTFIVRTLPDDPTPATKFMQQMDEETEWDIDYRKEAINSLVNNAFVLSGVQNAHIAGRYLWWEKRKLASDEVLPGNRYAAGCVGVVVRGLLRHQIGVRISEAVYPNTTPADFNSWGSDNLF